MMKEKEIKAPFKERFHDWLAERKLQLKKNVNIIRELVKKNIKIQYRGSAIGAIWTILNPLLNMLVMWLVFANLFGEEDSTYPLYLLCGNIMFSAMRGATTQSLTSLVQNRGLLTKNRISYSVFPLSRNLTAVVNFLFSCGALIAVMLFVQFDNQPKAGPVFSWNLLYVFLMIPAFFLFTYGISLLLSALYVFFRDVQHFYTIFLTLWTYLTPIFYKREMLGEENLFVQIVIDMNPMYHFVTYFRAIVYDVSANGGAMPSVLFLYLIGISFLALGALAFVLTKRKFIFYI